ncbi:response regulator [Bacillus alkalicellulosilyticus]|uniref:response regulator n=1 Tax=Alkalihalobacterium alkalicellulosilyticum TaxID=1912214 RepID=UPI00148337D3|nr:response regulator [Bacillus alkalicellulosilyticus]
MKLKTKLYFGFGLIVVLIFSLGLTFLHTLNEQNKYLNVIVKENYERVKLAKQLREETQNTSREVRELLIMEQGQEEQIAIINESRQKASITLDELRYEATFTEEAMVLISSIQYMNSSYTNMIDTIIDQVNAGNVEGAKQYLLHNTSNTRRDMLTEIDRFVGMEETEMNSAFENGEQSFQFAIHLFSVLILVTLVLIIGITLFVVRGITDSINQVRNVITKVSSQPKENLARIEVKTMDEIGEIAEAYNQMAASLEEVAKQERQLTESLKEENWIKTRYAEIAMKFQGIQKLPEFGKAFLSQVSPFVNATYGVLYVINDNNELMKLAGYAADGEDIGEEVIPFGQGLVGQCAKDNTVIYKTDLPPNYIVAKSGLGEAIPTSLLLIPIAMENNVFGVLELAKFEPFIPLEQKLLEQVCSASSSSIIRILDHMKIEELLIESQTLTEELQSQSEELQQQQEELRLINEQLHDQYKASDEKTKELELIKLDLEEKNRGIQLSSKYKSEFLANMSHELRTPLNSMLILSQLLSENHEGNLHEKQIEHAMTIYSSGRDLLELINDILDLSKIESGKIEVYPEELLVSDIRAFVQRQFSPISRHKNVPFIITVHEDAPSNIFTDDQRLKQILKNLLSNAFKFTEKGRVELICKKGSVNGKPSLVFTVIDTGIGISKEKQETIFEAFYQGDGTTSRKFGGTGLGLSISRELAQLLGGYIEVESIEGIGSTFTLHVPDYYGPANVHEKTIAEIASSIEDSGSNPIVATYTEDELSHPNHKNEMTEDYQELLKDKVVLVVDDDMRNVFALTTALEMQNMKVLFVENGKEAVELVEKDKSIDIVLMDIMMPEMNGYEAMTSIRQMEDAQDLPIIALTAKAMKNDKEKCIKAGASDYISKPVNIDQLLSLIKVWLYK